MKYNYFGISNSGWLVCIARSKCRADNRLGSRQFVTWLVSVTQYSIKFGAMKFPLSRKKSLLIYILKHLWLFYALYTYSINLSSGTTDPVKGQIVVLLLSREMGNRSSSNLGHTAVADSLGDISYPDLLPEGWEERRISAGRLYYVYNWQVVQTFKQIYESKWTKIFIKRTERVSYLPSIHGFYFWKIVIISFIRFCRHN